MVPVIYFPDPTKPDATAPGWDENPIDYYRRSTKPEA
jgi:hypothetical protein